MARSLGARIFAIVVLVSCVVVLAGGTWYFFGQDLFPFPSDDDVASDDEPEDVEPGVDGGIAPKAHRPGKRRGKGAGAKGARAGHAHSGGGGSYDSAGKSYEAAITGNHEQLSIGGGGGAAADLTDLQLAGPMRNGTFLGACGTPPSTHVTVKVAIRGGRAVGVSVSTNPPNPQIAGCIDRSVRGLAWPVNAKMDSFVTTY